MSPSIQRELRFKKKGKGPLPRVRIPSLCIHCGTRPVPRKGDLCLGCRDYQTETMRQSETCLRRIELLESRPHGTNGSASEFESRIGQTVQQMEFPFIKDPADWLLKEDPVSPGKKRKPLPRLRLTLKKRTKKPLPRVRL